MAEMAFQQARAYAAGRVQGVPAGRAAGTAIIGHPDVRRMLLLMRSQTEAARAVAYVTAAALDLATRHPVPDMARRAAARAGLLVPIFKGWATELAVELASLGIQVHGGLGYIEETGAAQLLRDARITTIYEGTTGIQANDLVFRKLAGDGGAAADALLCDIGATAAEARALNAPGLQDAAGRARAGARRGRRRHRLAARSMPRGAPPGRGRCRELSPPDGPARRRLASDPGRLGGQPRRHRGARPAATSSTPSGSPPASMPPTSCPRSTGWRAPS